MDIIGIIAISILIIVITCLISYKKRNLKILWGILICPIILSISTIIGTTKPVYKEYNYSLDKMNYDYIEDIDIDNKIEKIVKNELLFLVMGVDSEHTSVNTKNGLRSDTIMLCKINKDTGTINILSIPRDTRVEVKGKLDKINHSHAYGGTKLTLKTVRDFTGLDIDYYVKIDYNIVKSVVDSIGGVEIDVPFNMKYNDPTAEPPLHIDIKKGLQKLDGQNAINYLRWRHNNNYSAGYKDGDLGRINAQQKFMKELFKQVMTPKNILNIGKLAKSYYNNVEINIPLLECLGLITSYEKFNIDSIKMETIDGVPKTIEGVSYYIPNKEWLNEKINSEYSEYIK